MVFKRFKDAIDAGQRATQSPSKPPEKAPKTVHKKARESWALIHFDDANELEEIVSKHAADCLASKMRCIIISNRFPPSLLSKPDIIFEFAPTDAISARDNHLDPSLANEYLFRRLLHITSFWGTVRCTWTGGRAAEILDAAPNNAERLVAMSQRVI